MSNDQQHGVKFKYDPTINLGHIVTMLSMAAALLVWGIRLESRVDHEVDLRSRLEKLVDRQNDSLTAGINRLDTKLDRLLEQAAVGNRDPR